MKFLRQVDQAFFGMTSPVAMGVYRAALGLIAFITLAMQAPFIEMWYGDSGYVPLDVSRQWAGTNDWMFNLLAGVTDLRITIAFFIGVMIAALFTTVGLFSRVSTVVLAMGIVTLHHRDPLILNGGDTLLRVTLITLALMPSGAAFSLDRWRRVKRGLPVVDEVSVWPQRLIQIQLVLMYGTTVWHKMTGSRWRDGTATWYPANLQEFARLPVPSFVDQTPFMQISTYGTILIQVSLATLVFAKPLRKWVLLGGVLMHLAIEYRFNIPMFAFICLTQYICHYSGTEVQGWLDRCRLRWQRRKGEEVTV